MSIIELPLPQEIVASLPGAANDGTGLVGVSANDSPEKIVEALNEFVANPPKAGLFKRIDNWNERAMPLGALWGQQLVRKFGWEWALVDFDGDRYVGVFDRQRSMGVLPFDYVFETLEQRETPTILLAFNMIAEGALPKFEGRSYTNIMEGIQHIVEP